MPEPPLPLLAHLVLLLKAALAETPPRRLVLPLPLQNSPIFLSTHPIKTEDKIDDPQAVTVGREDLTLLGPMLGTTITATTAATTVLVGMVVQREAWESGMGFIAVTSSETRVITDFQLIPHATSLPHTHTLPHLLLHHRLLQQQERQTGRLQVLCHPKSGLGALQTLPIPQTLLIRCIRLIRLIQWGDPPQLETMGALG